MEDPMMGSTWRKLALAGGALMVASVAVLAALATAGAVGSGQTSPDEVRQEQVAERGAEVMPFDLEATTHVYEKTEDGGVQKVVADDPGDAENVAAIRAHLEEEAAAFSRGEYSDPARIHGEDMPGLAELEAGAEAVEVRYEEVPGGARIILTTRDRDLVRAVHDWFDAQLSDHGGDAREAGDREEDGDAHEAHH